jgi:probable HAF family extracellular repeat protein
LANDRINDAGEIVGRADFSLTSTNHHAFLWKNGKMIDLGVAPGQPCSTAIDINSRGQIIINTGICGIGGGPGVLWEHGNLYVLNNLIPANSDLSVGDVNFINDRGEIAVTGHLPNGDQRAVVLVPCDQDHPGLEDCDYNSENAATNAEIHAAQGTQLPSSTASEKKLNPFETTARFRSMTARRALRFGTLPRQ